MGLLFRVARGRGAAGIQRNAKNVQSENMNRREAPHIAPAQSARTDGEGADLKWQMVPGGYRLDGASAAVLPGGWYGLRVDLDDSTIVPQSPVLNVDYGLGFVTGAQTSLRALVRAGGIEGVIRLPYDARRLRLQFGDAIPGGGATRSPTVERLGRWSSAVRMFRARMDRPGGRLRTLGRLLQATARDGVRGFGDALYQAYHDVPLPLATDYRYWVEANDRLSEEDTDALRLAAGRLAQRPRISVLLPVFNPRPEWLRRCIESVLAQAYPDWELCVADDASTDPGVGELLRRYAHLDPRIKVVFRAENGHISAATNSALELASGEWLALLDHDDELAPHALYMVACTINEHPRAGVIYSDEDKVDGEGGRFDPYFKPDWNHDLLLGHNMISHLGVYRARLVREVGAFRRGFEGSQDYDLALRCVERLAPEQIVHIPHVLYHWRAVPGSTALAKGEKSYAASAGERAVAEHLARSGVPDVVVESIETGHRLRWPVPADPPKVSLIVPTRDRVELLRTCVGSILEKTAYPNYEIIVVDNQSVERETLAYFASLREHARVRVLPYDAPFNFSSINNYAVSVSNGEIVGLINNDLEVIGDDWLTEMVSHAIRPEIGCVGAMLYYPNDTIQHAGVILGLGGVANHIGLGMPRGFIGQMGRARLVQNLSAVTAACLLVRRAVFDAVGGLDPRLQVAFNDVDFCLRVREKGYRNLWTPFAELYHHESASRGSEDTPAKRARFAGEIEFMVRRWGALMENDPAYNPNLTLTGKAFEFAAPPRCMLRSALGLVDADGGFV